MIGDAHYVAEKLVEEISTLGTTHLSCFMQIGTVEGTRAMRSLNSFVSDALPLMETAIGMPLERVNAERSPATPSPEEPLPSSQAEAGKRAIA